MTRDLFNSARVPEARLEREWLGRECLTRVCVPRAPRVLQRVYFLKRLRFERVCVSEERVSEDSASRERERVWLERLCLFEKRLVRKTAVRERERVCVSRKTRVERERESVLGESALDECVERAFSEE